MQIVPFRRIDAFLEREPWEWARANRARIAENWARRLREKPALFNGIVLVCTHCSVTGGVLVARFREADYASFLAMQDFGFPEPGVGNCFGLAALRTGDGAFIMGEMAGHTANGGRVYFPGGSFDRTDVRADGSIDVAGSVARELLEETGLGPGDVTFGEDWTAILDGPRTALLREVRSPLGADALKARIEAFLARETEPELSGIRIVRTPDDIDPAVMPGHVVHFVRESLAIQLS